MIDVLIDSHLHLLRSQLTNEQIEDIKQALTIPNPDKERAIREEIWGAQDWPDTIPLWSYSEGGMLVLPRGIGDRLDLILSQEIVWDDRRVEAPLNLSCSRAPTLRDYQEEAVQALLAHDQGVYEAPTGSGKTVTMLEAIRRINQRALVIVNSTHIAEQWRERAREHLGLIPGLIGDGAWDECPDLNIALQQTLWSRKDSLGDWWSTWGVVVLDECHHVPARTFYDIIQQFPARYRYGLSATPDKQTGREHLVRCSLGPTVHETDAAPLLEAGVIRRPEVLVVPSNFVTNFWPTHRAQKDPSGVLTCKFLKAGCNRAGLVHRNNWADLVKDLCSDSARNDLVAEEIARLLAEGRAIIILSRRLNHLDDLARRVGRLVGSTDDLYRLSSKEKTEERMAIYERAEAGRIAIFATVGDEALDIPRLDTVVLAFPSKNPGLIEQQIGRVSRTHPDKASPLVIDIADPMNVLNTQLESRMRVYRQQGMKVTKR